jgi:hypothetical protein
MRITLVTFAVRRSVLRRVPAGVATGPFEFAIAVGYLITGVRLFADPRFYAAIRAPLFPSGGAAYWGALLLVGSVSTIAGQLFAARDPLRGLLAERAGLLVLSAAIVVYLYASWDHSGSLSVAVETAGATLAACLFKAGTIRIATDGIALQAKRAAYRDGDLE